MKIHIEVGIDIHISLETRERVSCDMIASEFFATIIVACVTKLQYKIILNILR